MKKITIIGFFFSFSTSLLAQVECAPNTDFCYPQHEPGKIIVVPSINTPTIQSAIDQAPAGATIRIKGGEYFENIVVSKSLTFSGNNPPGRPTIIHANNSNEAIFTVNSSPTVEFKNLKLKNGLAGIKTDLQSTDNASIIARNLVIEDASRGIMGAFGSIELTKTEITRPLVNGLSISRIGLLKLKDVLIRFAKGYGMVIIGSSGSAVFASYVTVEGNEKGGIYASQVSDGLTLNRIVARNNFGAGIIIDHTPYANVQRSELNYNKILDGSYGNGLLVYSSEVTVSQSNFLDNEGFQTALVGCGTVGEEYSVGIAKSTFTKSFAPNSVAYALYLSAGCEAAPGGSLRDLGGNTCTAYNGPACKAGSAGGLAPLDRDL